MSVLRLLVMISSSLQILIGSCAAYRMLSPYQVDLIGLLLCSTVIAAGLASLSCLYVGKRPSLSRQSTIKFNILLLVLVSGAAGVILAFEQHQGISQQRLQFLITAFALCAAPFLINGVSLALIERRVQRLAI
ncbi:MAG: hypothetical protein SYC29_06195 [Planctomycetota bacterium]|nr:hypothetical protein [Planctomycetota bacterium]